MNIRRATPELRAALAELLAANELPPLPKRVPSANVLVAVEGEVPTGGIALEVAGRRGLVRAAVVAGDARRRGVGRSLLKALVARANELGLRDLYLVTEHEQAEAFFTAQGFQPVARAAVPREILATDELSGLCPQDARVMWLPLETRL